MFDLCFADEKQNLTEEKAKISYSVGYQVGGDFKRQGLDIKPEILLQGIQDAIAGVEPQMNQEEMRATLVALKKKITAAQRQQMKIKAAENLKTGKEFLAMNKEKEGVKTLASGLQYKVITEGTGGLPMATDSVTVNYRGTLIDGTEFDSSYSRNRPATFRLDQVIPGWTETLQLMKEGAKWQLFIPPELAYAERGAGSHIGPNSTLIFDVELISVNRAE
jgi:FKBP-type peptidyl-prolyl cis-trans isomerase FklB